MSDKKKMYKVMRDLSKPLSPSVMDKVYNPKKHNVSGQIKSGLDKKKKAKEAEIKKIIEKLVAL